jgi:hypothetical protein
MIDIGRARGDARLQGAASEPILSIVSRYRPEHPHQRLKAYLKGDAHFTADDPALRLIYPAEMAERRLALACDYGQEVPANVLEDLLTRALELKFPLLQAQVRRALGLARGEADELATAIRIWEGAGALTCVGRARAERGRLIGDQAEVEAGLAILRSIGDIDYVDRFSVSG